MFAVFVDDHQLFGLVTDTRQHPLAHLHAAHAGDFALSDVGHHVLNLDQLVLRVAHGGLGQGGVDQHAPVVDALVDVVVSELVSGQVAHGLGDGAHGVDVHLTVLDHLLHQRSVLAEVAVGLRDGEEANELRAAMILAHIGRREAAHVLERARGAVGAGLRGGAVELLKVEVDLQDVPKDQPLEGGVVRPDRALVLAHGLGERLVWCPSDDVIVIEGVGHAQHVSACVLRVVVHPSLGQVAPAAGFKIDPKD